MLSIHQVDLGPFCAAPFVDDPAFPSPKQLEVSRQINASFREHGFLVITNFGITQSDVRAAFKHTKALFDLTDEQKRGELCQFNNASNQGYRQVGLEVANNQRPADIRETFNFRPVPNSEHCAKGTPSGFSEWAGLFSAQMERAAQTFAIAMAVALGASPHYFLQSMKDEEGINMAKRTVVRLSHYPSCTYRAGAEDDLTASLRVGEHTDFGLFTLLFPGGPGLQIQVRDEHGQYKWVSTGVPQAPGAIVNTGAMLARWTNDFWTATNRRVVAESETQASTSRYSIVLFINPRGDTMIQADASFLKGGDKAKYAPIRADEYLSTRLEQISEVQK